MQRRSTLAKLWQMYVLSVIAKNNNVSNYLPYNNLSFLLKRKNVSLNETLNLLVFYYVHLKTLLKVY